MTGDEERLSSISTKWSLVFQAHRESGAARTAAQADLLLRYHGAIYRYLRSVVGDAHAAEDLCQEFAYRFVRGDFHRAHPDCGRFRDFVKTAVAHLIADWRRRQSAGVRGRTRDGDLPALASGEPGPQDQFEALWRSELLDRVWEQLAALEKQGAKEGSWFYTALRYRAEHSEVSAAQMAAHLGRHLGRPLTEENVRSTLRRGREKFAQLLIEEVRRSLPGGTPEQLRAELVELGVLSYCRRALEQRGL
jgi:RNA polymerase sigma-70 factor (ECF subfamily)